jgi:hypothetical protein
MMYQQIVVFNWKEEKKTVFVLPRQQTTVYIFLIISIGCVFIIQFYSIKIIKNLIYW